MLCQFIESKLRAPVAPAGPTRPIHLPPDNGSGGPIPPGGSVITFPPFNETRLILPKGGGQWGGREQERSEG